MGEPRTEQGDQGLDTADPDACLAEVDLDLGARIMDEWDRDSAQAGPTALAHPRSDGRLAAPEAVFGDQTLPDPPSGVALFVVDRRIGLEPGHDDRGDRVHDRSRPAAGPPVCPGALSSSARRIVVRLWWKARASSRMLDPSRKWAYRIRSISSILINLSSRTAAALNTGTVLADWGVKVVLL
jgi:hypothetical protein